MKSLNSRPVLVEKHLYKQLFIAVEIYEQHGGGFHVWPYIGFQQTSLRQRFLLGEETFLSKIEALKAAIAEGQAKIDAGYDPRNEQ